ncbi:MAG: ComEC/Rec2 family competence protein [Minisyncoccia bacterium]|jgi:competence protein ComEC
MTFSLHPADMAFGIALLFLAGIFVAGVGWHFFIFFAATLLGGVAAILYKRQLWKECAIFLCAAVLGALYYHFFFRLEEAKMKLPFETLTTFQAFVSDEPQPSEKFLIVTAEAEPPYAGTVKIMAPPESDFPYGEILSVTGTIVPSEAAGSDPVVFSPKNIAVLATHRGFWLRERMLELKLAILAKYREVLPEDQAALLGGIAFGSKVYFKKELKDAMALSGTTHLVAVSGYNITIVIVAARDLFKRFFSRRATFFAAVVALVLFMFMVGLQASAVRAAIMGFLALVAREMGEEYSMRNAIVFTAAFMALLDPSVLTGNVGFILSFLSLAGIVYLGPPLKRLLRYREDSDGSLFDWKENAATTLSAQLMVMPVLINSFGRFSLVAILANILILSTVPLTMFFGALFALLGFVSHHLIFFAAKLVGLILAYQLFVMRLFAALAVPVPLPLNSAFAIALYYLIIAIFIFSYGRARRRTQEV